MRKCRFGEPETTSPLAQTGCSWPCCVAPGMKVSFGVFLTQRSCRWEGRVIWTLGFDPAVSFPTRRCRFRCKREIPGKGISLPV
jgi:hypothetical protein